MTKLIFALILGPFVAGSVLYFVEPERARRWMVTIAALATGCGTVALALQPTPGALAGGLFEQPASQWAMFLAEAAMAAYVIWIGIRSRKPLVLTLMLAQLGIITWLELGSGSHWPEAKPFFVDKFTVIMALINGLVGGGICLYALGYMRTYHAHAHPQVADRRPLFFALLFVFIGAMFGVIFANSLLWLFLFWEITTICSFVLIGYTRTAEAQRNAVMALTMNLAGGVAFAAAIAWARQKAGVVELQALITSKQGLALLPAALLCFAGIAKSAQLPFCSWLLGAMVAPTPVSALLHSSTMVKAGVYLVLRLAPIITGTTVGLMVALVGALTFLVGSLAAIAVSDAKKVLAYSTVANLGLIVLCGGIGTYEAVWAGVLLIVFHAVAKCLLFLCVGVVEAKLHSRDIEAMSGLILNMPRVAVMMLIGMAGMFLAPFGMLISKWAVLKAVVDASPALTVFLVFGSAGTLFFWVKWMGKLLEVFHPRAKLEEDLAPGQATALYGLSAGTFLTCLFFPWISTQLIQPYVVSVFGISASMEHGNLVIMMIMMVMIMLFPLSFLNYGRGVKVIDAYLGGANLLHSSVRFLGSAEKPQQVATRNYYLRKFLSEAWLSKWSTICAAVLLAIMMLIPLIGLGPVRTYGQSPAQISVTAAGSAAPSAWIRLVLYLVAAPIVGGLLAGWDRRISARMQSRRGPPILQPFYDVLKLWQKENIVVRRSQNFYVFFYLVLVIFTGGLFFAGSDLLLVVFALTLGAIFMVLAAYKASSPYSFIGAERELLQMMAYEPMLLLTAVGMYMVTGSFYVHDVAKHANLAALALPGIFLGFLFTLVIKFRKSPFDLSFSHHAHQELVRGISTEFSGRALAMIEVAHWFETVFLLGWVFLFFAAWPPLAILVSGLVFAGVILIDNVFARLKWQKVLGQAWVVTALLGFGNILAVSLLRGQPAIRGGFPPAAPSVQAVAFSTTANLEVRK